MYGAVAPFEVGLVPFSNWFGLACDGFSKSCPLLDGDDKSRPLLNTVDKSRSFKSWKLFLDDGVPLQESFYLVSFFFFG